MRDLVADMKPVRDCLKSWAIMPVRERRAMVLRAKALVPLLPEYIRVFAKNEIAAVEVHCRPQG